jgi:hypothetical protein
MMNEQIIKEKVQYTTAAANLRAPIGFANLASGSSIPRILQVPSITVK